MNYEDFAIWWTTTAEANAIALHFDPAAELCLPEVCPPYLREQWRSRFGRAGRGRLWISDELVDAPRLATFDDEQGTALQEHCTDCAGIVICRRDVRGLMHLPGIVTDFDLVRL